MLCCPCPIGFVCSLPLSAFRRLLLEGSERASKEAAFHSPHASLPLFSLLSLSSRSATLGQRPTRRDYKQTDGRGGRPYLGLEPSNTIRRGRLSSDSERGWIGGSKRDRTCGMNGFSNISKFRLKNEGPHALVPLSIHGGLKRDKRLILVEVILAPFYPLLGLLWGEHSSTVAHHSCSLEVGERVSGLIMLVGRTLQMLSHSLCMIEGRKQRVSVLPASSAALPSALPSSWPVDSGPVPDPKSRRGCSPSISSICMLLQEHSMS